MDQHEDRGLLGELDRGRELDPAQIDRTVAIALRALLQAIRARRTEHFQEARGAFQTAIELGLPSDLRRRAEAEIAHLLYYDGRFADGVVSARRVLDEGPRDFARALALLALSVNQLANNEAPAALRSANEALLEMRVLGAPPYHLVNVRLQLVHVTAQMGRADESVRIAREARAEADHVANTQQLAHAEYGLGYALWAAGDLASIDCLVRAEQMARGGPRSLHAWIVFCLACALRDFGFVAASEHFLAASSVTFRHERAWFDVRRGDAPSVVRWLTLPIQLDEIPFVRCVCACIRLDGQPRKAATLAERAARTFRAAGLQHYWRGAAFIQAAALLRAREMPNELISDLIDDIERAGASNWGLFQPAVALDCLAYAERHGIRRDGARRLTAVIRERTERRAGEDATLLLARPGLLSPNALSALRDVGLTSREIWVAVQWLQDWLNTGGAARAQLASALAMSDSALRAHVNSIRAKLGIERHRGVGPLVEWLVERDLLTSETSAEALLILLRERRPREAKPGN